VTSRSLEVGDQFLDRRSDPARRDQRDFVCAREVRLAGDEGDDGRRNECAFHCGDIVGLNRAD
jgi:hypothetical protein